MHGRRRMFTPGDHHLAAAPGRGTPEPVELLLPPVAVGVDSHGNPPSYILLL